MPSSSRRGRLDARLLFALILTAVASLSLASPSTSQAVPAHFYGAQVSLNTVESEDELVELAAAGVTMIRMQFSWQKVEEDGWSFYDTAIENATKHDIAILGLLYGRGAGAKHKQFYAQGDSAKAGYLNEFVTEVVSRYGYGGSFWAEHESLAYLPIWVWEVWNEPNLKANNPGGEKIFPKSYAKFLKDVKAKVHEVQDEVEPESHYTTTLFGGLYRVPKSGNNVEFFLEEAAKVEEVSQAFSGLSFHPYSFAGEGEEVTREQGVYDNIDNVREWLSEMCEACSGKSIWVTELGWPVHGTGKPTVTEAEQASLLTSTFGWLAEESAAKNIQHAAWYLSKDIVVFDPEEEEPWDYYAGLQTNDRIARPSWCAYVDFATTAFCPPDLVGIAMNSTGSETTEMHMMYGDVFFSRFNYQATTGLGESSAEKWRFALSDVDSDGYLDLIAVAMNETGSGMTEVHILDGSSGYQKFLTQAATGLGEVSPESWQLSLADASGDGVLDLIAVALNETGSETTEVHILDGSTNFSEFILHTATGLGEVSPESWQLALGDASGDGTLDLIAVAMNSTGSEKTEVHILDGSTGFSEFILNIASAMPETSPSSWQFIVNDLNGDGLADLAAVGMNETGSGKTEVHFLNAATYYTTYMGQYPTVLDETNPEKWQFAMPMG